ncbi:MAG: 2Fe-2S iron-sulfur cluster binding domain-containing protein [Gammaproteobacteria bacterium]|nr:2Fe-2S iron-sulfur cluster binding domain-containing protein [Gammaproteobacteria bacterium]
MKKRAKEMGLDDIRVNNAGCLERCELGPAMVVYPEGIWYHYENTEDIDEILEKHIVQGNPVERLLLKDGQKFLDPSPPEWLDLVVSEIMHLGDDCLTIEFKHSNGEDLPEFSAGAHLGLLFDRHRLSRYFSLINNPVETNRYLVGAKDEEGDDSMTDWIASNIKVGDEIKAHLPTNTIELNESAVQHTFFGEGSGVLPLLSMCHRLLDIDAGFKVHYLLSSLGNNFFLKELKEICGKRLTLHLSDSFSEISATISNLHNEPIENHHLYLCGSADFMTEALAKTADWPVESVHTQYMSAPKLKDSDALNFSITLARRTKTLRVGETQSVFDVLQEAGLLNLKYACEDGLCGACKVKVLFGEITHRDFVLTAAEKNQQNAMISCVSRAAEESSRLILDI